jgi:hypothetical protein
VSLLSTRCQRFLRQPGHHRRDPDDGDGPGSFTYGTADTVAHHGDVLIVAAG